MVICNYRKVCVIISLIELIWREPLGMHGRHKGQFFKHGDFTLPVPLIEKRRGLSPGGRLISSSFLGVQFIRLKSTRP